MGNYNEDMKNLYSEMRKGQPASSGMVHASFTVWESRAKELGLDPTDCPNDGCGLKWRECGCEFAVFGP